MGAGPVAASGRGAVNEDFRYVAAIAEHGSISKAARAVHISQPGLSQRLRRLEAQMDTELFDRSSLPLKPTASGEVYLKYALRAIAAEESMRREVHGASRRRRSLRVGVSVPRANALLARPVVSFYESHCGCTLELREMGTLDDMHRLFLGDGIDFAVLTPIVPDPGEFAMEVLCRERLQVVVSERLSVPQLDKAAKGRVSLRQLEGVPFVLPACGGYFDPLISRIVDMSSVQLDIVVRDCSAELALSLVQDGLGVSVVPSTWLAGREGLRVFDVDGIGAGNVLRYIRRLDKPVPPEEALFMDILRNWLSAGESPCP